MSFHTRDDRQLPVRPNLDQLKNQAKELLRAIRAGKPLAEAIEAGVTTARVPAARRPQLVRQWFTAWAELGWICAPDLDQLVRTT